jgi:soluble lytic murein transglycosylase-like protein
MDVSWMSAGAGPQWLPALGAAEDKYKIPRNLLARVAFEESSFRPGVIDGTIPSSVGALGILQLMPQFFPSVRVPVPFTNLDTLSQIDQGATLLASLFVRFNDWQVALAAYNWGGGDVHHEYTRDADQYVLADMPPQTQNYVKQIVADVSVPGALVPIDNGSSALA